MYQQRDWSNLAQLLAYQPHRLSPEELKQAVEDYCDIAAKVDAWSKGSLNFADLVMYVRNVQETYYNVVERWDATRLSRQKEDQPATYQHKREDLDAIEKPLIEASKTIANIIFPSKEPKGKTVKVSLNPAIRKTILLVKNKADLEKSDQELLEAFEVKHGRAFRNIAKDTLYHFTNLGYQAINLHFFAVNRFFPQVLPDNPYSREKSSEEAAKKHYEDAEKKITAIIDEINQLYEQSDFRTIYDKLDRIHSLLVRT